MTALDDSPPPELEHLAPSLPDPRPSSSPRPFGWATPEEEEEESLSPAGESLEDDDPSPGAAGSPSDEEDGWTDRAPTSSPASSGELRPPTPLLSKTQMRETARTAVRIGGGMAHTVGARTEEAKDAGLWLTDAEDERNIGHPLADYFHSKGDLINGKLSPEANYALQGLMGIAGYLTKQVTKVAQIREDHAARGAVQ